MTWPSAENYSFLGVAANGAVYSYAYNPGADAADI